MYVCGGEWARPGTGRGSVGAVPRCDYARADAGDGAQGETPAAREACPASDVYIYF